MGAKHTENACKLLRFAIKNYSISCIISNGETFPFLGLKVQFFHDSSTRELLLFLEI